MSILSATETLAEHRPFVRPDGRIAGHTDGLVGVRTIGVSASADARRRVAHYHRICTKHQGCCQSPPSAMPPAATSKVLGERCSK